MAQPEPSQAVARTAPQVVAAEVTRDHTPAQVAWLRFVDRVERGEITDPRGQYVAKGTPAAVDAAGHRVVRPKFDAATNALVERRAGAPATNTAGSPSAQTTPDDPSQPCGECPIGPITPTTSFVSSEGDAPYSGADNPNGYIYDLKVGRGYAQGDHDGIPNSYTVLYSDLNKGAGGPFMYIGFTRVPGNVSQNPEIIYNEPYNFGPVTLLGISKKYRFSDDYPFVATHAYPVWADTGVRLRFAEYDLNQDVGGTYIRARQAKYFGYGAPIEIGVLSSNSSTTQPPTGWTKVSTDLNEGAGGDFIYFCAKPH